MSIDLQSLTYKLFSKLHAWIHIDTFTHLHTFARLPLRGGYRNICQRWLGWVEIALPHKAWLNTSSTPLQCDHLSLYAFSDLKSKLYPIILVSSKQRTLDWTSGCRLVCSETGEIKFRTEPYQKQDTCWNKLHEQNLPSCFFPHYVFCWCLRKLSLTKIICIALARRFLCLKSSSLFFLFFPWKALFFPPSPLPIKNKVKRMHAWVKQGLNCWLCFRNTSSSPHFSILRTGLVFHVKARL